MATADIMPQGAMPEVTAQQLPPGITDAKQEHNPVLPSQQPGDSPFFPPSNVPVRFLSPGEGPDPRPSRVQFAALRDPRLRMIRAIPLNVSVEESEVVVVSWPETDEFGTGETLSAALDDFAASLRDLYHQLFAPGANLGADLQRVKQTLEHYIQPRK